MKRSIKNNPWPLIFACVFILSVPSIFRIFDLKDLYLSKNIRNLAVESNVALRKTYGIGATDAKLKKIETEGGKSIFYFDYKYNHPGKQLGEGEKYFVEFDDDNLKNVGKIEK